MDLLLRALIPIMERRGDVNHVYAEVSPWLYFRTLQKKPIVLTIASERGEVVPEFIERCSAIAVQTERMKEHLLAQGVAAQKLRLIYPGVDLSTFASSAKRPSARKSRILFATFPRTAEELELRGALFLIEVARRSPQLEFSLLARPWRAGGTALQAIKDVLETHKVPNVRLIEGMQDDMASLYAEHDFTVIPYTRSDGGKECPLSLVESLACGVPVLISNVAPFSTFVTRHSCGRVFGLSVPEFCEAVDTSMQTYARLSEQAVACAREYFDRQQTLRHYAGIYRELRT